MDQPKVILVVMDGWGYRLQREGNAIAQAKKPNFDLLWQNYPHALLEAAGEPVGLPWGSIGSSEVGHACLGAGRIIHQDFPRISKIIATGEFYKNPVLLQALNYAQKQKSSLHLVGLVSAVIFVSRHLSKCLPTAAMYQSKAPLPTLKKSMPRFINTV